MLIIPYARQAINDDDIAIVTEVLKSDWLTQGPTLERFEEAVKQYCGAEYAIAVCNATSALHLACRALGVSVGDTVWTSPNTFVASANCARYCGATVDFVDIDPKTYNMSATLLEIKLKEAEKIGKLPKVVIVVHFAGQSCEMEKIAKLAKQYGFFIIEDAAHSIGAAYQNKKIGLCEYSDVTVFSFHPVKIITTGEGGMLLTNHHAVAEKIKLLRSHGITRDVACMDHPSHGPWYYEQIDEGYNYRMTDIQAALGVKQMGRLDEFIQRRRYLAARYHEKLAELPIELPTLHPDAESAWHLYVIQLKLSELKKSRREIVELLHLAGIKVNVHYIPVHTQPYYKKLGFKLGDFPLAEKYYACAISLPLYFTLQDREQDFVVDTLKGIIS